VASGVRLDPVSDSEVSMSFQVPFCSTRTGPANVSVCSSPDGSAYVVESAARSGKTSILRFCRRAISNAAAVESADDAAELVSSAAAETSAVPVAAANTAPDSSDTSAVSAASTAAIARAVRLSEPSGGLLRPLESGTCLPANLKIHPCDQPVTPSASRVRHYTWGICGGNVGQFLLLPQSNSDSRQAVLTAVGRSSLPCVFEAVRLLRLSTYSYISDGSCVAYTPLSRPWCGEL